METGARVVALCDVNAHRLEDTHWLAERIYAAELGPAAARAIAGCRDFHELLARPDIDGVLSGPATA